MPGYRAVLFDFFGTLTHAIRRGPAHATIARRLGCDPDAFATELNKSFLIRCRGGYGPPLRALERVARSAGATPTRAQLRAALVARTVAVRSDIRLRAEAVPVLTALRDRGLRTGLISDCTQELPSLLPGLPIAPLLDTCVYSIELGTSKPDPRMYLTACERLAISPADCLFIGDGGNRELSGARAAGITAVRLAAPDLSADHLVFNAETGWSGPSAPSLSEAIDWLDRASSVRLPAARPALASA